MNGKLNCHRARWIVVALLAGVLTAVAAFAAPAAQARHGPAEHAAPSVASTWWVGSATEADRLGPKLVTLQRSLEPQSTPPATTVKIVRPAGFDWGDALIGAAVAAAVTAALAVAILLVRRDAGMRHGTGHKHLLAH